MDPQADCFPGLPRADGLDRLGSVAHLQGLDGGLSANPIKDVTEFTGIWTLRFLMITLAITPLRRITGMTSLIRFRRMLGLFTFFQGFLHWMTYIGFDQEFIVERDR